MINHKKIIEIQNSIELNKLDYKNYNFNKVSLPAIFFRNMYTNTLSIESDLFKMFGNLNKGRKSSEKM